MAQRRHEAPELAAAARRMLRALAVRATEGDTEAIEQLAQLRDDVDGALAAAVAGARERVGYSWTDIANLTGTTRQNAQQRFGKAQPPVTYACEHDGGCGQLFPTEVGRQGHYVRDHGVERCAKVTQPKPRHCAMPEGHTKVGQPHVMAADEPIAAQLSAVVDELTGGEG